LGVHRDVRALVLLKADYDEGSGFLESLKALDDTEG